MASTSGTKNDGGGGGGGGLPRSSSRRMTRAETMMIDLPDGDGSAALDSEFVPSSMSEIVPILRVPDEIEQNNRRVAYLCRFHALQKAYKKDPISSGRGVRQFKTYLLHKLEKEEHETVRQLAGSDPREIQLYFQKFYVDNIRDGQHVKKPEEMAKLLQIATVLYDVLRTVVPHEKIEAETEKYARDVARLSEQPVHYNILPLYSAGIKPAIMELPEIKASLRVLSNVENLPMPNLSYTRNSSYDFPNSRAKPVVDILDWVSSYFGFQKGNVANQREHLILLLANIDARNRSRGNNYELKNGTIEQLMDKIFRNYESWCHYVRCESNLKFPSGANR